MSISLAIALLRPISRVSWNCARMFSRTASALTYSFRASNCSLHSVNAGSSNRTGPDWSEGASHFEHRTLRRTFHSVFNPSLSYLSTATNAVLSSKPSAERWSVPVSHTNEKPPIDLGEGRFRPLLRAFAYIRTSDRYARTTLRMTPTQEREIRSSFSSVCAETESEIVKTTVHRLSSDQLFHMIAVSSECKPSNKLELRRKQSLLNYLDGECYLRVKRSTSDEQFRCMDAWMRGCPDSFIHVYSFRFSVHMLYRSRSSLSIRELIQLVCCRAFDRNSAEFVCRPMQTIDARHPHLLPHLSHGDLSALCAAIVHANARLHDNSAILLEVSDRLSTLEFTEREEEGREEREEEVSGYVDRVSMLKTLKLAHVCDRQLAERVAERLLNSKQPPAVIGVREANHILQLFSMAMYKHEQLHDKLTNTVVSQFNNVLTRARSSHLEVSKELEDEVLSQDSVTLLEELGSFLLSSGTLGDVLDEAFVRRVVITHLRSSIDSGDWIKCSTSFIDALLGLAIMGYYDDDLIRHTLTSDFVNAYLSSGDSTCWPKALLFLDAVAIEMEPTKKYDTSHFRQRLKPMLADNIDKRVPLKLDFCSRQGLLRLYTTLFIKGPMPRINVVDVVCSFITEHLEIGSFQTVVALYPSCNPTSATSTHADEKFHPDSLIHTDEKSPLSQNITSAHESGESSDRKGDETVSIGTGEELRPIVMAHTHTGEKPRANDLSGDHRYQVNIVTPQQIAYLRKRYGRVHTNDGPHSDSKDALRVSLDVVDYSNCTHPCEGLGGLMKLKMRINEKLGYVSVLMWDREMERLSACDIGLMLQKKLIDVIEKRRSSS